MLFALLIIVPVLYLYRRGAPLYTVYFSLAAFSFFWQLVCALTITIRGDQAESAGLPKESSRRTAYAMSWIGVVLTLFQGIFVFLDM